MNLTFMSYDIRDDGVVLWFHATNPGAGRETEYSVFLTDAEVSAIGTQAQFTSLVGTKLGRKLKSVGIASKLDAMLGRSVTI